MSDLPTSPDGHDPIAELSARTATITVHEENGNGGYASLPPPGSREWSPANTVTPQDPRHGGRTPVQGEQEVNYGYQDQHQYMDYPLGMPMAQSTFSPVNTDWNGQTDGPPYPYILPPPPPMPLGRIVPSPTIQRMPISMNPSEHTQGAFRGSKERFLRPGEPFAPLTPVSDARNRREGREGQEDRRSSGVYQPPHIIRMQQQRHPQERPYAPHRQELPYTPQSDMQRSFQRRGPLKEQRNEAGEWRAGPRNNVTGGMVFKNATPHNGGERKRHAWRNEEPPNVPYTPRPQYPTVDGAYMPESAFSDGPLSPRTPMEPYGFNSPPPQRQLSQRFDNFGSSPMGHFGMNSGLRMLSGPYTPPSMRTNSTPREARYPGQRSSLLEDFRINKLDPHWQAQDLTGFIVEFSGDQYGSRFIQTKIAESGPKERQKIFDEILPSIITLMQDVFGNYVIQKLFEIGDSRQMSLMVKKMEGKVLPLSMHMYGCRVVQKAVEFLPLDLRRRIVTEIEPHILQCVKSSNANHVVQCLINFDPPRSLAKTLRGHFQDLATNPYGCRVIQKMVEQLDDAWKEDMMQEMHPIASELMENQYGNYVVQSVIAVGGQEDRQKIIDSLKGRMLAMSRHKFASNVCEKALQHATPEDRRILIDELIAEKADGSTAVPMLLGDAFGNFPLQYALSVADDDQRAKLLDLIIDVLPSIGSSTPVGRRLVALFTQMEADGMIASASERGANMRAYLQSQSQATELDGIKSPKTDTSEPSTRTLDTDSESSEDETSPSHPRDRERLKSTASTPVRRDGGGMERRRSSLARHDPKSVIPSVRNIGNGNAISPNDTLDGKRGERGIVGNSQADKSSQ